MIKIQQIAIFLFLTTSIFGQHVDNSIFGLYEAESNRKCGLGSFLFINPDTSIIEFRFSKGSFSFNWVEYKASILGDTLKINDYFDFIIAEEQLLDILVTRRGKHLVAMEKYPIITECWNEQFEYYGVEIIDDRIIIESQRK